MNMQDAVSALRLEEHDILLVNASQLGGEVIEAIQNGAVESRFNNPIVFLHPQRDQKFSELVAVWKPLVK